MDGKRWVWLGCLGLLACSGGEQAPGSGIMKSEGGSGGAGGSAGSLSIGPAMGGSGGMAGGGGAPVALHTCSAQPEPACPAKVVAESVVIDDAAQLTALEGVTQIMGDLTINATVDLTPLSCLTVVDGELEIDLFGDGDANSLWGLRNLRHVGQGIDISASSAGTYVDCGLSLLGSVGDDFSGGSLQASGRLMGVLGLSYVKSIQNIRVSGSLLTKLALPTDTTLTFGQLALDDNQDLSLITGFTGITFSSGGIVAEGVYTVRIVDNPVLPECRAQELAQVYRDAGATEESITVMGNMPCAM